MFLQLEESKNGEIPKWKSFDPSAVSFFFSMPTIPQESELISALISLKNKDPSLGISKVHALLLQTYPEWTVSEKRTRKILQIHGLVLSAVSSDSVEPRIFPSSQVIDCLDISQWTPKVKVKYFNKTKGKGLVAEKSIELGEHIWKEDPFIIAPEW
jgi:hypothetical protein